MKNSNHPAMNNAPGDNPNEPRQKTAAVTGAAGWLASIRERRHARALLTVGAMLLVGVTGSVVAYAATTLPDATVANSTLVVNDGGQPLFALANMLPSQTATACELVTNTGPDPSTVGIYADTTGSGLDNYLALDVTRGTLPDGTTAASCTGFTADTGDYTGNGPGVIYSGSLHDFPTDADDSIADPEVDWPVDSAVAYEMTVTLADNNAAQGLSAVEVFNFGANMTTDTTTTTTTTTPTTTTSTTPTTTTTPVTTTPSSTVPTTTTTPTTTTPTTTTPTTTAPKGTPLAPVTLNSDAVTRKGVLNLTVTSHGKGTITATAFLYQKAKPAKGKKRKLVMLGRGTILTKAGGTYKLSIQPHKPILTRYRSASHKYRIELVLKTSYAATATTAATTTTKKTWVSRKSLAGLAKRTK